MPKFLPSSASATLTVVAISPCRLVRVEAPASARRGSAVHIRAEVYNPNAVPVTVRVRVIDRDTGSAVAEESDFVSPRSSKRFDLSLAMPGKDWRLRVRAFYQVAATEGECRGSPVDKIILLEVPTSITLVLSPATVAPGGRVSASGRLTRRDTGAGLANMTVELYVNDTRVGTTRTGSDGRYSISFNAPTSAGVYTVRARFPGATVMPALGSSRFLPSEARAVIVVGAFPWPVVAVAVPLAVVGGAIAYNELSKR